ncbi:MAG: glycosyltransferase [Candidatus Dormibacteraeota bacterium]|nr:glycosyltransferase [Candidatus Dormibacteraeota bacterium]MDQ6919995.1 glycosyltransferase [Candidatus Dormibacteraeota bacterium]
MRYSRWIVIPARNEAARLTHTASSYLGALSSSDRLVIVVNGSSDDTARMAGDIANEDGRLEVVEEPRPIGKGGAIMKGFEHVLNRCANEDVVCVTDADGAVPAGELIRVCDSVERGVLVAGSRWLNPKLQRRRQPFGRRLASRVFNRLVWVVLHLDLCDTQCPAKAIKASDLRPVAPRLNTTGFGFDLDLLMAAPLGRAVVKEVPIEWGDRDGSTVRVRRAAPDMVRELLRLRSKYTRLAAQAGTTLAGWSAAVCRPGQAILPDARRCEAARQVLSKRQAGLGVALLALLVGLIIAFPLATAIAVNGFVIAVYVLANFFKLTLVHRSFENPRVIKVEPKRGGAGDVELPVFTILVPLYHEAPVVAQLVDGIAKLDYPHARLDVKLLLEEDDFETQEALEVLTLPSCFEGVVVPDVGPPGKPRACNEGLRQARGDYLVIYDAEDRPEPDQLRKVVAAFETTSTDVVCLQAKLNYFNREQNLLTRWFTAEYSMWFDLLLPGLRSLDIAIPLGGTSNFFVTDRLRELGGWDAYNVTEDADLGLRLHEYGWRTAILDSTTYEEASSRSYNWIRQRSRWIKGYLHTYLIHTRHPLRTYRAVGGKAFIAFHLFFAGAVAIPLINPIYWAMTVLWYVAHPAIITALFPAPVFYIGTLALFLGNLAFALTHVWGAVARGNHSDVKWALLSPIYWLMISLAAWRGLIQLLYQPHHWEKTEHGFFFWPGASATTADAAR